METPVTSLGTRSGVHWTRRNARSSERATARASVVFPTPGTSSSRTCPSTRSAANSCSVAARLPTTMRSTCSARRPLASRTLRVTRGLCGLERTERARFVAANGVGRRDRDGQASQRRDPVEREEDRILLADEERRERALDEEDERDREER